jgi:polysaccharide biosynthesis protein PslH
VNRLPSLTGTWMGKRLKVLFLANRVPYPIRDGQARRSYHVLKGLAEAHDVHLLALYQTPEEAARDTLQHLRQFCTHVEFLPAPPKTPGVQMALRLLRSLVSRDPYTVWRHYSTEYRALVKTTLATSAFDVVHCDILPMVYALRDVRGPLRVLTDHDVSYLKAERLARQRRNPLLRLLMSYEATKLKRLEQTVLAGVDLGIAVSETDKRTLEALSPGTRLAVVENGVDVDAFCPASVPVDPDMVVWVGGFNQDANYEAIQFFLKKVHPAVRRAHPRVRLVLVGGGSDRLKAAVAGDPSVELTGAVEDPNSILVRAAVFIAPILSGSGTKLKVLEAMAAGKAIVSTSVGMEGIDGVDGEHYVLADTPDSFAAGVIHLLACSSVREQLALKARQLAEEKYDWRLICEKMNRLYTASTIAGRITNEFAVID